MDMNEIIKQAEKNNAVVIDNTSEGNPCFKERMQEYMEGLKEDTEENR